MITQEHIITLANNHLKGGSLFITGVKIGSDNAIKVFIDGDNGVSISDCVNLSRAIEGNLDREKEDFSLDVSSHGAASPIVMPRQYKRHIGRQFEIKLLDGLKIEGTLTELNDEGIKLEYTVRENKTIGKGKIDVIKQHLVKYNQIKESKIKLKY